MSSYGPIIEEIKERVSIRSVAEDMGAKFNYPGSATRQKSLCVLHEEKTPSMEINTDKNTFCCYGCGKSGSVIDLVMHGKGIEFKEAVDFLATTYQPGLMVDIKSKKVAYRPQNGQESIKRVGLPVPGNVEHFTPHSDGPYIYNPEKQTHSRLKQLAAVHPYKTRDNQLLGYILRKEFDTHNAEGEKVTKKITPTVQYCEYEFNGNTRTGWAYAGFGKYFDQMKPLYFQEKFREGMPLLIVEGEKAADAAQRNLTQLDVTTWPGGTNGIEGKETGKSRIDMTEIAGKRIVIWPDADLGGFKAAMVIAKHARGITTDSIFIIDPPQSVRGGWDLADAFKDGWQEKHVLKHMKDHLYTPQEFAQRYSLSEHLPRQQFVVKQGMSISR